MGVLVEAGSLMLHRGTVIDNSDPTDTFRLKVRVPTLSGNSIVDAWPVLQRGAGQALPEPGDSIWVSRAGDSIVWLGTWAPVGSSATEMIAAPSEPAQSMLLLPGAAGDYVSTPDAASLDVASDLDVRIYDVAAFDWTPAVRQSFVGKWDDAGQRSWVLFLQPDGALRLFWSTTGSDFPSVTSTATLPSTGAKSGQPLSIWMTLVRNNGAGGRVITFYYSTDHGVSWSALGAPITGAVTSIFASTTPVMIGARNTGGTTEPFFGEIGRVEIRDGVDGTVVAAPDFSIQAAGVVSFADAPGNVWTLQGNAEVVAA
jgi:hypothetical protein